MKLQAVKRFLALTMVAASLVLKEVGKLSYYFLEIYKKD